MGSEFLVREDLENMMTLVFSVLSFILHLAHQFANFRRSLRKSFAAICTFLLAAHRAVSSANWDLSGKVMDSGQNHFYSQILNRNPSSSIYCLLNEPLIIIKKQKYLTIAILE